MTQFSTKIKTLHVESGKRILVTSDIHGYLSHFKKVLQKADFSDNDVLIIVGDMIEKGPDSLGTLRYVMELCKHGNVIPLIGNVDAWRISTIEHLSKDNASDFFDYITSWRPWAGSTFFDELAAECGFLINSPEDMLRAKPSILTRFAPEFEFLASLPTIVETQNYVFVHGGLREKSVENNLTKGLFELTKYDAFAQNTPHVFDKYVIVGHWPTALYSESIQQLNPIVNREKHIISIDGGCGVKNEFQLNLLILPDVNCSADRITHVAYDEFPAIRALEKQSASRDSLYISWINRQIEVMSKGKEFATVRHLKSGRTVEIPNVYLKGDFECADYTDYVLEVKEGDVLGLIAKTSRGCIVKKDGVVGWYMGRYEHLH